MGLFDLFKNAKNRRENIESDEDHMARVVEEIMNSYHGFFADVSKPLRKCRDRKIRATLIGSEIPMITHFDFENFSNLMFNEIRLEIKDKRPVFWTLQSSFYVLCSDRFLFQTLGNDGRNEFMELIESAYLNKMMTISNNNRELKDYLQNHLLEYEKETAKCNSIDDLLTHHQLQIIKKLQLQDYYIHVRLLLNSMIVAAIMSFNLEMLSTLEDEKR